MNGFDIFDCGPTKKKPKCEECPEEAACELTPPRLFMEQLIEILEESEMFEEVIKPVPLGMPLLLDSYDKVAEAYDMAADAFDLTAQYIREYPKNDALAHFIAAQFTEALGRIIIRLRTLRRIREKMNQPDPPDPRLN